MKKAKITINTDNDTAQILGIRVKLQSTSSGHYCVPVSASKISIEHECNRSLTGFEIDPQHDILLKNMSPKTTQRSRPTTKDKPDSSNTNYEWKHVTITERTQNGPEQMISMCRVTDQVSRREFSLDLNSLPPGTRLIMM